MLLRNKLLINSFIRHKPLRWIHCTNYRNNKEPIKVTLTLGEILPQKESKPIIDVTALKKKDFMESLPPLMRSVRETMDKYKGYVVITQVGSFYELYFEDAVEIAPKLNITLTKKKFKELNVPMAGFPLTQLDRHLKVLVKDLNLCVAVSEQFKRESSIDNDPIKVSRRVTRVISAGTLVDEAFLNEQENNYLLAIDFPKNSLNRVADPEIPIGLAWIDISVGTLFVQETSLEGLASAISRIKPSEILLSEDLLQYALESGSWYQELIELKKYFIKYQNLPSHHKTLDLFYNMFNFPVSSIKRNFSELSIKETSAMRNLLNYIQEHFPETTICLQLPEKKLREKIMQIDSRTSDALELNKTYRDQLLKGSLLSSLKRTVTQSGARLLSQWLMSPSTDISEITTRQKMVTIFHDDEISRKEVIKMLKDCHDISRIVQKFSMGRGSVMDLVQLANTVETFELIKQFIIKKNFTQINELIEIPESQLKLSNEILRDIDVDHLLADLENQQNIMREEVESLATDTKKKAEDGKKFYIMKRNASKKLKELHDSLDSLKQDKVKLESSLIEKLIKPLSLKEASLKLSTSLGYQLYIKGTKNSQYDSISEVLPGVSLNQKSQYTRWYNYPKYTSLGNTIESTGIKIEKEEASIIKSLIKKVIKKSINLREIAKFLDTLDVTTSFASLATEKNLVCPEITTTTDLEIIGGRHLVVENSLLSEMKRFSSNDLILDKYHNSWIITGPNMGGKSTFLRQNAIIVIMAQMGSYVPAISAKIGIVDKVFSRVNSTDDLSNNMSTFMVEMVETSYILKGATEKSLTILDEIGRGTSAKEGTAVAFASLNHLMTKNKSRILFSTHYGDEINHLIMKHYEDPKRFIFKKVTASKDEDGKLYFDRELVDGISEQSYAIEVAEKAGFPVDAIKMAELVMKDTMI